MRYGILDKVDDVWIGNDEGPRLFDDLMLARVAAQMAETQAFGHDMGCRYEARAFPDEPVRMRDKVMLRMDALAALKRLEGEE